MFDAISVLHEALRAQAEAERTRTTLALAHDGEGCARVADHRPHGWGAGPTQVFIFATEPDREDTPVCGWEPDATPRAQVATYAPVVYGEITLVREWNPTTGDTLHVFASAYRDDARAARSEAHWRQDEDTR